jgi:hypothetical protein
MAENRKRNNFLSGFSAIGVFKRQVSKKPRLAGGRAFYYNL